MVKNAYFKMATVFYIFKINYFKTLKDYII